MKLLRSILPFLLLLLSFAGTAQTVQNDASPSDSPIIFNVVIENEDGSWGHGYIKSNGEVIAEPQFYSAWEFKNGMARVKIMDKTSYYTSYIDTNGVLLKQKFGWLSHEFTPDGLCMVRDYETEKWGFINKKGEYVIKPRFDEVEDFSEGLARVKVDGKYGYVDYEGKMVVKPQFDIAEDFSEGLAQVIIDTYEWHQEDDGRQWQIRKIYYIDKAGNYVSEAHFLASRFCHGLARVMVDGKYGFIDKTENMVLEPQFDFAPIYVNGFFIVRNNKYYGLVDTTGKIIFEPQSFVEPIFHEGYALISTSECYNPYNFYAPPIPCNYGFIDKTGKIVIKPQFGKAYDFCNGFSNVYNRRYELHGFINKKGDLVIPYQFKEAKDFSENGLAAVRLDDKWGYIDTTGKFVIEPKFQYAGSFRNGMARVETNDKKWGYIDMTGKYLQLYNDYVGEFQNGFATFHKNEKVGVIDTTGKIIIEPKYDRISW